MWAESKALINKHQWTGTTGSHKCPYHHIASTMSDTWTWFAGGHELFLSFSIPSHHSDPRLTWIRLLNTIWTQHISFLRAPSWSAGHTAACPTAFTATVPPSWRTVDFVLTVERMPVGRKRSRFQELIHHPWYPGQTLGHRFLSWPPSHRSQPHPLYLKYWEQRSPVCRRGAERRARAGKRVHRVVIPSSLRMKIYHFRKNCQKPPPLKDDSDFY